MAENIQTDPISESNPAIEKKRAEIRSGTIDSRTIVSGDTIAKLAQEHGIHDYHDLIILNQIAGTPLRLSGPKQDRVVIRTGETIKVPQDPKVFSDQIAEIRRINQIQQTNKALEAGATKEQIKTLRSSVEKPLFPGFRQSLGMSRLNAGLIGNLQASMHMSAPRQVDPKFEGGTGKRMASCAHYYRQEIRSAINPGDMPEEWSKFMNKKDIDAWELPAELLALKVKGKDEFTRTHNLMEFFDVSKFGNKGSPVLSGQEKAYADALAKLDTDLMKPEGVDSAVPVYYRYSNFQRRGLNQWIVDPHYNTHMVRNVGMASVSFQAREFWEVRDGQIIPFGFDEKKLRNEIGVFQSDLSREQETYKNRKSKLETTLSEVFKEDYQFMIDKRIDQYVKGVADETKREDLRTKITSLIQKENPEEIKAGLSPIIHYAVTDDDAKLLIHWQRRKRLVRKEIENMREKLSGTKHEEVSVFDSAEFKALAENSSQARTALKEYNESVDKILKIKSRIEELKTKIAEFKAAEEGKDAKRSQAMEELKSLDPSLKQAKSLYEQKKAILLVSLDENRNETLKNYLSGFEVAVKKHFGAGKKANEFIEAFTNGKSDDSIKNTLNMKDEDFNFLKRLHQNRTKVRSSIAAIQTKIGTSGSLESINANELINMIGKDNSLSKAITEYNQSVASVNHTTGEIEKRQSALSNKKELTAIDHLLNILQQRADYSKSALTKMGRDQILEGLKLYAKTVHVKIDGKPFDLEAELAKKPKDMTNINPDTIIEFSGPLMSDGFHMENNPDPVERDKMQGRQRFFFELLATQTFFPSESIAPTEGSLMRRTDFRERTDKLREKGTYFLHPGEELGKKIKELIPIYEKDKFDNLDPNAREALIDKYYALQINALRMMGYMQSENQLNLGAVKINMAIPYFDTTNIPKIFADYIKNIKGKIRSEFAEFAAYTNHVELRVMDGDHPGTLRSQFLDQIKLVAEKQGSQYPNLRFVGGFNDFLLRVLMQESLEKNELTSAQETDKKGNKKKTNSSPLSAEEYLNGKLRRSWQSAIVRLDDINRIAGKLQNTSHTLDVSPILKSWDNDVINLVGSTEQNRNLMRLTMYAETYEYENGKPFVPNGISLQTKGVLERNPVLQNFKSINSFGDFQIREIKSLTVGFGSEWITKKQLQNACAYLQTQEFKDIVSKTPKSSQFTIQKDLEIANELQSILQKATITQEEQKKISELLQELIHIDTGKTGETMVGKIIGASLLNDKINGHFQKLDGALLASWEDPAKFANDPDKMSRYEKSIFFINNKGEKTAILGFGENLIYRIIEQCGLLSKEEKAAVHQSITLSNGRSTEYGTTTFVGHAEQIKTIVETTIENAKGLRAGTPEEMNLLRQLIRLAENIESSEKGIQKRINEQATVMNSFQQSGEKEKHTQAKRKLHDLYIERDNIMLGTIYTFVRDPELHDAAEKYAAACGRSVDISLLPTAEEFQGKDVFRSPLFGHARKAYRFEKLARTAMDTEQAKIKQPKKLQARNEQKTS